jgi:large subunit ribosomal protein L18
VYRSLNHIYAQIIDDEKAQTLAAASTTEKKLGVAKGGNIEAAKRVGQAIGERALAAGINSVVFDRGGYLYHGRVRALTDAARAAGLNKDETAVTESPEATDGGQPTANEGVKEAKAERARAKETAAKPKKRKAAKEASSKED